MTIPLQPIIDFHDTLAEIVESHSLTGDMAKTEYTNVERISGPDGSFPFA